MNITRLSPRFWMGSATAVSTVPPEVAEELVRDYQRRTSERLCSEREAALAALPKLNQAEAESLQSIDKEITVATAAEKKARTAWNAAVYRLRTAQARRSSVTTLNTIRRDRLQTAIEAGRPQLVEQFVEWCDSEIRDLSRVDETSTVEEREPEYGWQRPLPRLVRRSTAASATKRTEALIEAKAEALRLASEPLPFEELRAKLDAIRDALPAVEFEAVG